MDSFDATTITDEQFQQIVSKANPCPVCSEKDNLALGVVTEVEAFGRFILFCAKCNLE